MSKLILSSAINGATEWVRKADEWVTKAIAEKGADAAIGFPSTAYYLPIIYSFTGREMKTLSDLQDILKYCRELLPGKVLEKNWLPYLGQGLDAGVAALFACEAIEACKYLIGPNPVDGIWLGAANDIIMRERGVEFVDGSAPGFAAITGAAPDSKTAAKIATELQQKNIYVFMAGSTNGVQFADQLAEEGVQLGWETRLVPFGEDVSALVYPLGFASRTGLSFGGVAPGDYEANLKYNKNRVFAFVLAMGEVDEAKYAMAAGAINYGFPVIADTDIPEILPTGVCTYEHVVSNVPYDKMVEKALEVRGCKIKITEVPIPVPYGAAFEGERIRKEDTQVEFGGQKTTAFEYVTSADFDAITDGEIELIGPDVDEVEEGALLPLGIWVEVAGRKMQSDFEPILERQIHHLVNGAEGIWHMGQRDIVWTRISKNGFKKGLRIKDYGEIIHAMFQSEYPALVDKVKVTLITDKDECEKRVAEARRVYDQRNRRLEAMTDESVDTFYSCLLCQSFAPDHVCIITPERLGLCGAYNWLDGKAAYEIDETGANQPVQKGECIDPVKGIWKGVNEYVYTNSHKTVESYCAYSIMDRPMTSCGCFEAICAYVPECNGVMVVNREFMDDTPIGMTFSSLAGSVGGGKVTPGFVGVGKVYLTSRKFIAAEGGYSRLVWMPKDLKEALKEDLEKRFKEQDLPDNFLDMIADETVGTTAEEVRAHLEKVGHPALKMTDMTEYAESEEEESAPVAKAVEEPTEEKAQGTVTVDAVDMEALREKVKEEVKQDVMKDVVSSIINTLSVQFLGGQAAVPEGGAVATATAVSQPKESAAEIVKNIKSFEVRKDKADSPIWEVTLGATKENGGTRGKTYKIGGDTCMPFHLWEGDMPNKPLIALEVLDNITDKYPPLLKEIYGEELLHNPAEMAKVCVDKYGAELISVRLEGTHPEKGDKSAQEAVDLVKSVLEAVDVPLIITGHSHFDKNNEVLKAVAQSFAGENLLLNWVEQDNYKTIAGAAMAYDHSLVAQSPIDVNIAKQLSILLTNMDFKKEKIVIDPTTSAIGYGIEYTYSVMERIRLSALGGDEMLCAPMIVSPGVEVAKIKEAKAPESAFPAWGDLAERAAALEYTTALSYLYSGAGLMIMYNPQAAMAIQKQIVELLDGREGN
ncbi:CO dehydrogenase/CO-methylating acetyl-CoA synthase complex subunit beta [Christensenellaceae bacterium OttesenSCG-928-K19]|nr:CO dehydrogenase/CO-methylating acetyl-CoA synthase complex subunit beta [Christensenellaceae bacterium OttesenSCG-928-K19]